MGMCTYTGSEIENKLVIHEFQNVGAEILASLPKRSIFPSGDKKAVN